MITPATPYRDLLLASLSTAKERIFAADQATSRPDLERYKEDPVGFTKDVLGHRTWKSTRWAMRELMRSRKVAICSCRKSSKTHGAAELVLAMVCTARTRCIVTSATGIQVRDNIFSKVRRSFSQSKIPLPGKMGVKSLRIDSDWYAIGVSTNQPGNIAGFHADVELPAHYDEEGYDEIAAFGLPEPDPELADDDARRDERDPREVIAETIWDWKRKDDGARLFFVLDEFAAMDQEIIEMVSGSWMGNYYVFAPFNPTFSPDSDHPAARSIRPGSGWYRIHIAGREVPAELHPDGCFDRCFHGVPVELMPDEWVAQKAHDWGPESALYLAHVLGLPAALDRERQFIPLRILRGAFDLELADDGRASSRHIGWDVAASDGGDFNVASLLVNGKLTEQVRWRAGDVTVSADKICELMLQWKGDGEIVPHRNVHVDATGVGKGAADYLRKKGIHIDAVDFGAAPKGDHRALVGEQEFANRKAELLWVVRCALNAKIGSIPQRFEDTVRQAQWYTHEEVPRAAGTVLKVVEDKPELKKLYGRSPDEFESVMLAWSRTSQQPRIRRINSLRELR